MGGKSDIWKRAMQAARAVITMAGIALFACGRLGFDPLPAGEEDASTPARDAATDGMRRDARPLDAAADSPEDAGPRVYEVSADVMRVIFPVKPGSTEIRLAKRGGSVYIGLSTRTDVTYTLGDGTEAITPADSILVVKYDSEDATVAWTRLLSSSTLVSFSGINADAAGNVFVAGDQGGLLSVEGGGTLGPADSTDSFIVSYDASGAFRWTVPITGPGNEVIYAAGVDSSGNAFVVGGFTETVDLGGRILTAERTTDNFLASYDASGRYRWSRALPGNGLRVSAGGTGGALVAGRLSSSETPDFGDGPRTTSGPSPGYIAAYGDLGTLRWAQLLDDADSLDIGSVATDRGGNVYLAGEATGELELAPGISVSGGGESGLLASYDSSGGFRWSRPIASGATFLDRNNLQLDTGPGDEVYVAGAYWGTADFGAGPDATSTVDFADGFIVSMNSEGSYRWSRTVEGNAAESMQGIATEEGPGLWTLAKSDSLSVDLFGTLAEGTGGRVYLMHLLVE